MTAVVPAHVAADVAAAPVGAAVEVDLVVGLSAGSAA